MLKTDAITRKGGDYIISHRLQSSITIVSSATTEPKNARQVFRLKSKQSSRFILTCSGAPHHGKGQHGSTMILVKVWHPLKRWIIPFLHPFFQHHLGNFGPVTRDTTRIGQVLRLMNLHRYYHVWCHRYQTSPGSHQRLKKSTHQKSNSTKHGQKDGFQPGKMSHFCLSMCGSTSQHQGNWLLSLRLSWWEYCKDV